MSPDLSDYTALSRSLVFNSATRSQKVTLSIRDDIAVEDQFEQFFITLWKYGHGSTVMLNRPTASVTIEDNDSEFPLQNTQDCLHSHMSTFCNFFLLQWLQLDLTGPIQCVKMLAALVSLYLY